MNPELVSLFFALSLGLLIGVGLGVRGGLRLADRRRAALGAQANLSRLWPAALPQRTAADILAGIIRVQLGGRTYHLPVLPRGAARRWLEALDARFATLGNDLEKAGNDTPTIMVRLVAEADALLDLLIDYDKAGNSLLPDRATLDEIATNTEILRGVVEVWRAVNPLADTLVGLANEQDEDGPTGGTLHVPPTTPLRPMDGAQATSSASPTSSSSPISTPRKTASNTRRTTSSSSSSKRSGSAQASSTTARRTPAGAPASAPRARSPRATAEG